MGRAPCCSKVGLHRGPWSAREDTLLINYIQAHGEGQWRSLPKKAGLLRCGKSCRLRWMNYLRPDIKRGNISPDEDDLIIRLHSLLGNRWSLIAKRLPGRTDNEIKNYWNSHLSKVAASDNNNNKQPQTNPKQLGSSSSPNSPTPTPRSRSNRSRKAMKGSRGSAAAGNKDVKLPAAAAATKVHQPKASRVSPFSVITRSTSFDSGSSTSIGSGLVDVSANANNLDTEMFNLPPHNWSESSDLDVNASASVSANSPIICEQVHEEFPYGFDDATFLDGAVPIAVGDNDGNMLDHIFEEYQQLLEADHHDPTETDSFLDSLLL